MSNQLYPELRGGSWKSTAETLWVELQNTRDELSRAWNDGFDAGFEYYPQHGTGVPFPDNPYLGEKQE